jgi:hypothetical protein
VLQRGRYRRASPSAVVAAVADDHVNGVCHGQERRAVSKDCQRQRENRLLGLRRKRYPSGIHGDTDGRRHDECRQFDVRTATGRQTVAVVREPVDLHGGVERTPAGDLRVIHWRPKTR